MRLSPLGKEWREELYRLADFHTKGDVTELLRLAVLTFEDRGIIVVGSLAAALKRSQRK